MTKILSKIPENVNENNVNPSIIHKILNLVKALKKAKCKKKLIPYSALEGFLIMPLITLYDEYIAGTKLTEQKNPYEYIFPRPSKVGRNNDRYKRWYLILVNGMLQILPKWDWKRSVCSALLEM